MWDGGKMALQCNQIEIIIPKYVNHTATASQIQAVEEHLCICQKCRQYLSSLLDEMAQNEERQPEQQSEELEEEFVDIGAQSIEDDDKLDIIAQSESKDNELVDSDDLSEEIVNIDTKEDADLEGSLQPTENKAVEEELNKETNISEVWPDLKKQKPGKDKVEIVTYIITGLGLLIMVFLLLAVFTSN